MIKTPELQDSSKEDRLPWADWFSLAVLTFNIAPQSFWQLSLVEWQWLLSQIVGEDAQPMSRTHLTNLRMKYPDHRETDYAG